MSERWPDDKQIQRYLAGDLDESELDEMEANLLADPELLRHVEAESALRSGLRAVSIDTSSDYEDAAPTFRDRLQSLIGTPAWSYAASGVACVALAALLFPGGPPDSLLNPNDPYSGTTLFDSVVYGPNRSSDGPAIALSSGENVVIAIDAVEWESSTEPVSVQLLGADTVIAFQPQRVSDDLQLFIPIYNLAPGKYELILTGAGIERTYSLLSR